MRRASLISAGLALAALVLYAVAGYWIAPRFVRDALIEQAARRGVELRIEHVRTNPFALSLELEGIEATAPAGRKLGAARLARADLAWASLWGSRWRVQSLVFEQPAVFLPTDIDHPARSPEGQTKAFIVEKLEVRQGTLQVSTDEREARLVGIELEALGLSNQPGEAAQFRAAARPVSGGTLSSQGLITLEPLALQGHLGAAGLDLAAVMELAWPSIEPAPGQLDGSGRFTYTNDGFAFEHLALEAAERDGAARARAEGTMRFGPFATNLAIEASGIGPRYVSRWLPEDLRPRLVSGALSLRGTLSQSDYQGAAAVSGFRLDEADSGKLLLAWERLVTDQAKLEFSPLTLGLGEVVAQAPQARLVVEAGGSVNFAEAFAAKTSGESKGEAEKKETAPRVAVARLRVEQGVLHFADRSLETPFEATIRNLHGTVSGFSTAADDPALVALSGAVEKYGSAEIRGSINLGAPLEHADIRARFRNIDLAQLTPYVAKFAGYRVRSGRVSADLRYRVRDGELVGRNDLVFRELRLGEKVEREGLKSLPLDLMVALLADAEGRIDLDIPVTGNLTEPSFDLGGLVGRALAGAVAKVVTAPFRALARVFGGKDGESAEALAQVRFQPGSAELPPPEAESVAKVAKALAQRPALGVAVHGGFDAERDAAALRAQAVRREIVRRAGYESGGPLDFSEPKILRAARELYSKRIGDPAGLDGKALVAQLTKEKALETGALQELARKRAQAVGESLADHGVEPARVASAVREGAPTALELTTLASPALAQDVLVEAAQRKLNAAGFAAGPVDGVLGPRTEAALRAFQHATHLQVSGELDAATLNALGFAPSAATGASR